MPVIESLRPVNHRNVSANLNCNRKDLHGLSFYRGQSRFCPQNSSRFIVNSRTFQSIKLCKYPRVWRNLDGYDVWTGFLKNQGLRGNRLQANSSCEQDTDSKASSEKKDAKANENQGVKSSNPSSSSSPRREKQGKGGWWKGGKWQWQPIIQAQEIGILLLQLGIVMFVMRLLRPGIPLPGSEPRTPTTFVSVPYSDFLSKINSNQVHKVEVDGVHIMFRIKSDMINQESEAGSVGKLQESESLIRSVVPTKRIVYTTTRPGDIKTPYEKMLENEVEFGSPDKRSGGFLNSALVSSSCTIWNFLATFSN